MPWSRTFTCQRKVNVSCIQFFSFVISCEHYVTWYFVFLSHSFPFSAEAGCFLCSVLYWPVSGDCAMSQWQWWKRPLSPGGESQHNHWKFPVFQVGLILISAVVPHLQTARMGVDENIAHVLAGFQITLSPDRHQVVKIVIYYIWCVEGEHEQNSSCRFPAKFRVSALGTLFQKRF